MAKRIVSQVPWIAPDFVPETFGRLTTKSSKYKPEQSVKTLQDFICSCGKGPLVLDPANVKIGNTLSCGCLQKEKAGVVGKCNTKHGHFKNNKSSPEYKTYESMRARCYNPNNDNYHDYGGRGVVVYAEWLGKGGFLRWLAHMGQRLPGTTIDRFPNPDGNYEPGNVRWATTREQANNKRNTIHVEHKGKKQAIADWCRELGLPREAISNRIRLGWSPERAFTEPINHKSFPSA